MLESKKCVSLSSYAGQCQGRLRSLDEYLAGGLGVHDAPKLSKVMLSSTSWRAEKHAFAFLGRVCIPCSLNYSTEGTMYGTRNNKTRKFAPSFSQSYRTWCASCHSLLKSLRLLTVNFWLTGTLLLMKYKNFLEPTFERLC